MVTRRDPENRPARVATCNSCGASIQAGRRGPLPRRCADCKAGSLDELRHRLATARNLAMTVDRADVAAAVDRAGELVTQTWTRYGE